MCVKTPLYILVIFSLGSNQVRFASRGYGCQRISYHSSIADYPAVLVLLGWGNHMRENELQILRFLRVNSRETLTKLSKKTGMPISTLFDKLKEYREQLITRHTCLLDYQKLGFDLRVQLLFKVTKHKEEFESYLENHFQINTVFRINNGYDYLVEAIFKNMRDFTEFLASLDRFAIKERKEFYVLQDVKREAFLTSETHVSVMREAHPYP